MTRREDVEAVRATLIDFANTPSKYRQREDALDRLARLEALLEGLDTPHHMLVLSPNRWTIEHTLACRESGDMAQCEVHQRVADWIDEVGRPDLADGRYVVGDGPLPDALAAAAPRAEGER